MATFNPDVNKTNDPSYLGASQGTDRASLQPLAAIPELSTRVVTPDYKADRSMGALFADIGEIGGKAVQAVDGIIKEKIDEDVYKGVTKIRDEFGVAEAANLATGVAKQVGAAGNATVIADAGDKLPAAIQRFGNRVGEMTQALNQGELSNTYYYSRIENFVREIKSQYPGYRAEVDQIVQSHVGTNPANAVRSNMMNDLTNLQNKLASGADKFDTWERQNLGTIQAAMPDYFQRKGTAQQYSKDTVYANVAKWDAENAIWDKQLKGLAVADKSLDQKAREGEMIFGQGAVTDVNRMVVAQTNMFGIKNIGDLQKYLVDVQSGAKPAPTPEEKQRLGGLLQTMEQQADIAFEARLDQRLNENTEVTLRQIIRDPTKIANMKEMAKAPLISMRKGLIDGQTGVLAMDANYSKAVSEAAETSVIKSAPALAKINAIRKSVGDQALAVLMSDPATKTSFIGALATLNLAETLDGSGTATTHISRGKAEGVRDPSYYSKVINDKQKIASTPEHFSVDQRVAAVKSLVGPGNETLLLSWSKDKQAQVFKDLLRPEFTAHVQQLAKTKPEVMEWYKTFARNGFQDVFVVEAANANAMAEAKGSNKGMKLEYDEKKHQFQFVPTGAKFDGGTPGGASLIGSGAPMEANKAMLAQANARLLPLNRAINVMLPLWNEEKADPMREIQFSFGSTGTGTTTPIGQAVMEKIVKEEADKQSPKR